MNTLSASSSLFPKITLSFSSAWLMFQKGRQLLKLITGDKRYRWFQRAMWACSMAWVAIVVIQSIGYYVYVDEGKEALQRHCYYQAEALFLMAIAEVERSASYQLMGERDFRHMKALNNLAQLYRASGRLRQARVLSQEVDAIADSERFPHIR